jgi:hypothetical protein
VQGTGFTTNEKAALLVLPPPAPLTVIMLEPVGVELVVMIIRLVLPVGLTTVLFKLHVVDAGHPDKES